DRASFLELAFRPASPGAQRQAPRRGRGCRFARARAEQPGATYSLRAAVDRVDCAAARRPAQSDRAWRWLRACRADSWIGLVALPAATAGKSVRAALFAGWRPASTPGKPRLVPAARIQGGFRRSRR